MNQVGIFVKHSIEDLKPVFYLVKDINHGTFEELPSCVAMEEKEPEVGDLVFDACSRMIPTNFNWRWITKSECRKYGLEPQEYAFRMLLEK